MNISLNDLNDIFVMFSGPFDTSLYMWPLRTPGLDVWLPSLLSFKYRIFSSFPNFNYEMRVKNGRIKQFCCMKDRYRNALFLHPSFFYSRAHHLGFKYMWPQLTLSVKQAWLKGIASNCYQLLVTVVLVLVMRHRTGWCRRWRPCANWHQKFSCLKQKRVFMPDKTYVVLISVSGSDRILVLPGFISM